MLYNTLVLALLLVLLTHTYANSTIERDIASQSISAAVATGDGSATLRRGKRYLDFIPTTRMFYRVNCKNNIIKKPVIWANGYGFRMNTPINPQDTREFRRDTYEIVRDLMEKIGFSGKACILKAYCAAHSGEKQQGMIFKLLKYIFTLDSHDKRHFPYLRLENCEQILHSHCPLSFNNISPYTDDI